jgi:hypothetical protein
MVMADTNCYVELYGVVKINLQFFKLFFQVLISDARIADMEILG